MLERYLSWRIFSHLETGIYTHSSNKFSCVYMWVHGCMRCMWQIWEPTVGRSQKKEGWMGYVHKSAALLTGNGLALSPHSSDRCLTEKIFSQLEKEGRENIYFTIHHTGGGENWGGKKNCTCVIFYCMGAYALSSRLIWLVTVSSQKCPITPLIRIFMLIREIIWACL